MQSFQEKKIQKNRAGGGGIEGRTGNGHNM